ncbi:hypothetical protein B0H11DRAFT_1925032 [Mycena galericulata]|nr:hypothetical protein B0H11DRAFT_1925032 [Mycena galericulata]
MNTNFDKFPAEASNYKNRMGYHTNQAVCNPGGSFVEMEWADRLDWYHHATPGRAWIPMSKDEASETKWFSRHPIAQMVKVNNAHNVCEDWKQGNITFRVMENIESFELSQYPKRGIIIDVARDHREPHTSGTWNRYRLKWHEAGGEENLEVSSAVTDHPCYVSLNSYNEYFNPYEKPLEPVFRVDQGKGPQQKAKVFIIEFPGWARHVVRAVCALRMPSRPKGAMNDPSTLFPIWYFKITSSRKSIFSQK